MTLQVLLAVSLALAKTPPPDQKARPNEVLRQLAKDGYFKVATCREIADTVLSRLGLPETGKASPVSGKRGGFDRSKQTSEPPSLSDAVTTPEGTKIKILTKEPAKSKWQVTIEREKADAYLMSQFSFERVEGQRSCDLTEMKLQKSRKALFDPNPH